MPIFTSPPKLVVAYATTSAGLFQTCWRFLNFANILSQIHFFQLTGYCMASSAVQSIIVSCPHRAKSWYFDFTLFFLKAKSTIWRCCLIGLNFSETPNGLFAIYCFVYRPCFYGFCMLFQIFL